MKTINNYELIKSSSKLDGNLYSSLKLKLDNKDLHVVNISDVDENYQNTFDRMDMLITSFYSNHYNRELIIHYFKLLGLSQSNKLFEVYNIKFDTLDLVNQKLVSVSEILGAKKSDRVNNSSYFRSTKYSGPTHTKGKYSGYTKAYIKTQRMESLNCYFYRGKSSDAVYTSYISLFDVEYAKIDELSEKANRFILAGTTGHQVILKSVTYFDISRPSVREHNLVFCTKCEQLCDNLDSQNVCETCRARNVRHDIFGYSHKPSPYFMRNINGSIVGKQSRHAKFDKYKYYGVELEIELRRGTSNNMKIVIADEIMKIKDKNGISIFYCKSDSSLDTGFEIVSHPMTYNAWKSFDFAGLIYRYRKYIKSLNTETAGMHIHVSRNAFNNLEALKILKMTYEFPQFSMFISQRTAVEQNDWASLKKIQIKTMTQGFVWGYKDKSKISCYGDFNNNYCNGFGGHRGAWNFANTNTAECRLFKGNLSVDGFYKNIEYVESIIQFVKNVGLNGCKVANYVGYVKNNRTSFPYLNKFMDSNKQSLNYAISMNKKVPGGLHV